MAKINHYDYEFCVPDNWFDGSTVVWLGQPQQGYCPNVTITRDYLDAMKTSDGYSSDVLAALSEQFADSGYKVLSESALTVSGGIQACGRVHSFNVEKIGFRIQQWQVYVVKDKEAITITCSDRQESFSQNAGIFESIINSFKFLI